MSAENHSGTSFACNPLYKIKQFLLAAWVKTQGRFVQEYDDRVIDESACDT
jgi:hypothetical protein